MTYRTPESLIRQIMAESHAPALKIPEPARVADALQILSGNGITSASKKDEKTIAISNDQMLQAYDILDRAIQHGLIQAKPIIVSAESIPVDDHVDPVSAAPESSPPEGGQKIGEECLPQAEDETEQNVGKDEGETNIILNKRSLVNRTENQVKKIDEEELELNELDYGTLKRYTRAGRDQIKTGDAMDKRIERRKKGLEMAKTAKIKMVAKAAFGEEVSPVDTLIETRLQIRLMEAKGMRLLATHHSECGKHTAKVYKDSEWNEHRVKYFIHGKHHEPADSHHGDVEDAHDTARFELKRMTKLNGALKEAAEEEINELIEEFEQLDELSKKLLGKYIIYAADNKAHRRADQAIANNSAAQATYHGRHEYAKLHRSEAAKNATKVIKREKGIEKAVARLTKEEVAETGETPFQIDELSANTMTNYAVKAPGKIKREHQKSQEHDNAASRVLHDASNTNFKEYEGHLEGSMRHSQKARTHSKALKKVTNKIAHKAMPAGMHEEAEQIDELSKSTLGSYVRKSAISMADHASRSDLENRNGNRGKSMSHLIKMNKRFSGISKATKKLEEETLVETKQDKEKAAKFFLKHKEAANIHASVARAAKSHNYVQDAMDNVYSNHQKDLSYEDWHNMAPHVEGMLKQRGLR